MSAGIMTTAHRQIIIDAIKAYAGMDAVLESPKAVIKSGPRSRCNFLFARSLREETESSISAIVSMLSISFYRNIYEGVWSIYRT